MSTIQEIDAAVNILEKRLGKNYVLFHCNSTYPAKLDELNLQMIRTLRERYDCLVGYSGHEEEIMPSVIAPLFGACVIERHVTISHKMWGTDQVASLQVRGMIVLAERIQHIRSIVGDGIKTIYEGEEKIRQKLRG